jgi:NTE family protein
MLVPKKPTWLGRKNARRITLALQGGGALGGFVWGVLDRLIEDGRIEIEGISGTSSGAINGALFADGLAEGGPEAARERLEAFWHGISRACAARRRPWFSIRKQLRERRLNLSSLNVFYDVMHRLMVPYAFDAATMEPLRSVIAASIDFERLNQTVTPKLFVNATDIGTAAMRIFTRPAISVDALCASSCLPMLFHPVKIDGAQYWDGGFMGNPALSPLVYGCKSPDILLVQTEPSGPRPAPRSAAQLIERMSEISFTATLARELEAIALQAGTADGDLARKPKMPKTYLHMIRPDRDLEAEGGPGYSKFNAEWAYLTHLRDLGRAAADAWLADAFARVGRATTVDFENHFA